MANLSSEIADTDKAMQAHESLRLRAMSRHVMSRYVMCRYVVVVVMSRYVFVL